MSASEKTVAVRINHVLSDYTGKPLINQGQPLTAGDLLFQAANGTGSYSPAEARARYDFAVSLLALRRANSGKRNLIMDVDIDLLGLLTSDIARSTNIPPLISGQFLKLVEGWAAPALEPTHQKKPEPEVKTLPTFASEPSET